MKTHKLKVNTSVWICTPNGIPLEVSIMEYIKVTKVVAGKPTKYKTDPFFKPQVFQMVLYKVCHEGQELKPYFTNRELFPNSKQAVNASKLSQKDWTKIHSLSLIERIQQWKRLP